jgi:hypothetical protein
MTQIFDNVGNLVMDLASSAAAGAVAGAVLGVAKPANLAKVLAGAAAASAFASALAKPPASPSTVENKKMDDHFELGNEYLVQVHTDAAGNYKAKSLDPKAIGTVAATVTKDGKYSVVQHDEKGNKNQSTSGGVKSNQDSKADITTNNNERQAGGGTRETTGQGAHEEHAGAKATATNGTKVEATKTSQQNIAQGGDGRHVMKGDQAFINDSGGMHYEITKGVTINTKDSLSISALKEVLINTPGNIAGNANGNITFTSDTSITLKVGGSQITINPNSITILSNTVNIRALSNFSAVSTGKAMVYGKDVAWFMSSAASGATRLAGKRNNISSIEGTQVEISPTPPVGYVPSPNEF